MDGILGEFDGLIGECEGLGDLKDYVSAHVRLDKAFVLRVDGLIEEALKELDIALKCDCPEDEEFFKPIGGDPATMARRFTEELKSAVHFERGRYLMELGMLDGAKREFEIAKGLCEKLEIRMKALHCESMLMRVDVVGSNVDAVERAKGIVERAESIWHELDLKFKSYLLGEYVVALSMCGFEEEDVERLKRLGRFLYLNLEVWAVTAGVLAVLKEFSDKPVFYFTNAVEIMKAYDSVMFDRKMFEKRWRIVEEGGEDARFGDPELLKVVRDVYRKDVEMAKVLVALTTVALSPHAFVRILLLIILKNFLTAYNLAMFASRIFSLPLLSKLFYELAMALRGFVEGKPSKEDLIRAVIKLYYLHI